MKNSPYKIEELYNQKVRPDNAFNLVETLELYLGIPIYVFTKGRYNLHVEYIISVNNSGTIER